MKKEMAAKQLEINGVVQGVGFRPFLFVLANQYHLKGEVANTAEGVKVFVQGTSANVERFCREIESNPPLLSTITRIDIQDKDYRDISSFKIVKSRSDSRRATLISPDVGVCKDCLAEMQNPSDRRYQYPFINCTNCGPRYTIIKDIPYDRPKTSMKDFEMCMACKKEYKDPLDRRFHAQPNACPVCGPHVFLADSRKQILDLTPKEAVSAAAKFLKEGKIVAVKGLGGFHLACDASNAKAVRLLRQRKNRPHKPFALMAEKVSVLKDHVRVSKEEEKLLTSFQRPIVLLAKQSQKNHDNMIAAEVAPMNQCLGVMLPYTPLHYLLLEQGPDILVMTSGNRSGEPLSIDNADALSAFGHIADYFLLHNRDIYFRSDDSITGIMKKKSRFIRRSRGYAPLPVSCSRKLPRILACGAGMKNTICMSKGHYLFLSQHIGDVENEKTEDFFKDSIRHLKKILDIQPQIIAHDMHPGYLSTQYAMSVEGIKKTAVQHHHAHAAACMAENDLDETVIAVTLDGTGYGLDGCIWGGEILTCSLASFQRKAHLSCLPMPGGDAAVLEPWRMAAALLLKAYGREGVDTLDIPFMKQMDQNNLSFIFQMIEKKINCPLTSSAGRLFDAVSSLLCIRHHITHESQAAMELESIAGSDSPVMAYPFDLRLKKESGLLDIDLISGIKQIITDIMAGRPVSQISLGFHWTLIKAFGSAACRISRESGIRKVVLSGGVFYNRIIFEGLVDELEKNGLKVYTHTRVPTGDGGISFGQAVAAAAIEENNT